MWIELGWSSATYIFDSIVKSLLEGPLDLKKVLKVLIVELERGDWDCQEESDYFEHPLVDEIFRELHPEWFEEEEIYNSGGE